MLFIDTLMSVFWTEKGHQASSLQNPDESSFHTPSEPAAPLKSLPRPSLQIPITSSPAAFSSPSKPKAKAVSLASSPGRFPKQKHLNGPVEQKAVVSNGSDEETFTASLVIHPFTLKNMALKYVPDLKWNLDFGGVNWQFYVHVLSSERGRCDTALVGLKVTGDETLGSAASSAAPSLEDMAICVPLSSLETIVSSSASSAGTPVASSFEVGWKVVSNGHDVAPVAICPPSVHHIEADDDYVVEFTDEEFNFINNLEDGLTLHVTIKLLPQSRTHSRSLSEAEAERGEEEDDEEERFYDSEEDERAQKELLARQGACLA